MLDGRIPEEVFSSQQASQLAQRGSMQVWMGAIFRSRSSNEGLSSGLFQAEVITERSATRRAYLQVQGREVESCGRVINVQN